MTAFTKPLTESQLLAAAPSIFATAPHNSRSQRYAYVSTQEVLKTLRKTNFLPVQANSSGKRKANADQVPFAKHFIRLRQRKFIDADSKVNDLIPDVILTNSHDGLHQLARTKHFPSPVR